jgi:hypothetical protein
MGDWLKDKMIEFCEENWAAFIQRCEEAGIPESEVEQAIEEYQHGK